MALIPATWCLIVAHRRPSSPVCLPGAGACLSPGPRPQTPDPCRGGAAPLLHRGGAFRLSPKAIRGYNVELSFSGLRHTVCRGLAP